MNVLIATDGSEIAVEAARSGLSLFPSDAHVTLVTVVPPEEDPEAMAGGFEGPLMTEEEAHEIAQHDLASGREAVDRTGAAVTGTADRDVVTGDDVADTIVRYAKDHRADVVVMGESDKGWFRRALEGSVMQQVLRHSPCPVLIIPHHHD
jgi:nucleotide-binding universal stress UspA family protein